jgi:PAS domain S-box-containing protein
MESNEVFQKAFERSADSMLLVEYREGQPSILRVNEAFTQYYGYALPEVVGQNPRVLRSRPSEKQTKEYYQEMWKRILDPHVGYWRDEIVNVTKTGELIDVILTISALFDEMGQIQYFIANHVDITRRVMAEKKTEELNEVLKILNKTLRHDILNDLTVIDWSIKMAPEKYAAIPDSPIISNAVNRSKALIGQMKELEMAISAGKALEPHPIRPIINQAAETFPEMQTHIDGEGTGIVDEAFKSVIENIIRNAKSHGLTDYMDIAIRQLDGGVEIRLIDYGKGIPDEVKGQLFQEGFMYGETGHSGLGLYIVRKTIERYGGTVKVENSVPQGTTFVIWLRRV